MRNRGMPDSDAKRRGISRVLILILVIGYGLTGCGVKAPPAPPRLEPPPGVSDLEGTIEGEFLRLSWTIPVWESRKDQLAGFRIYRSRIPLSEAFCETCPIAFEPIHEVPITKADRKTGTMTYRDRLEKGNRYIYRLLPYTEMGIVGPESNVIRFTHP